MRTGSTEHTTLESRKTRSYTERGRNTSWGQGFVGHVQKRRRGQPNDGGALRPALLEPDGLLRRRVGVRNNTARRYTGRRRERRRRRHGVAVVRWAGRRPLAEEPRSPQFARVRQLLVEGRREAWTPGTHAWDVCPWLLSSLDGLVANPSHDHGEAECGSGTARPGEHLWES